MAQSTTTTERVIPRGLQFALAITALAWAGAASVLAAQSARGITTRFNLALFQPLMEAAFLLFLVVVGLKALDALAARGWQQADVLPLPRRATSLAEWGTGAALGWSLALAVVLPVLVSLHLHSRLTLSVAALPAVGISLLTLLTSALAQEAIFRGYAFRRLIQAVGPAWASVLLSAGFAVYLVSGNPPRHLLMALLDGTVFGLLLSIAYLRTHALWAGWGLHFTYRAVAAVVFGLPVAGHGGLGALTDTYASGPRWLSGGAFGLDAAFLTVFFLLAGIAILYRVTRDYAWQYTHREILPAGQEVTIAPPAAHVAMEKAAAPPPLVQILSSTSQSPTRPKEVAEDAVSHTSNN